MHKFLVPKLVLFFVNHKRIINLGLNFWWRERGGGSQHTNQPKTKQCSHLHPLIPWARGGSTAAVAAAATAAAKLLLCVTAVATKTPLATAMAGARTTINNQLSMVAEMAMEMATMTGTLANKNRGNGGGGVKRPQQEIQLINVL
jgi:hypothetical protein